MSLDINSPFRKITFADNPLKGRQIKGLSESPEYLAMRRAVVRWQKRKDIDILTARRRGGRLLERNDWKYITLECIKDGED